MLSTPVVLRAGVTNLLQTGDLVNTREADDLSSNAANPTTITAAQFTAADLLFADPGTPEDIVTLPTAEAIIANIIDIITGNAGCTGCASELTNTTVWAQVTPQTQDCGCGPGQSARLIDGATFRRTFYRNTLGFTTPIYLEKNTGITWDAVLENIGEDEEVPANEAVLFHNNEWKEILFRILNSSPTIGLVGDATNTSPIITVADETLITNVTVGQRLYTADDTVFVSSDGELTVTAIDYFTGEITVSGNAVSTQANLSFTLTPHIEAMPCQSGLFLTPEDVEHITKRPQWLAIAFNQGSVLVDDDEFVFHLPAGTIKAVYVGLKTPSDTGEVEFDILQNAVSILSTKITIDVNEDHSKDAAVPPVISDTTITDWARMTLKCLDAGANAVGPTVYIDYVFD